MADPVGKLDRVPSSAVGRLRAPTRINLQWQVCDSGRWWRLEELQLESIGDVFGVYAIWHGSLPPLYVRVGQGTIQERLARCRADPEIAKYSRLILYATWAAVMPQQADGVEAYLACQCRPLVGESFPDRTAIRVNLPFLPSTHQALRS